MYLRTGMRGLGVATDPYASGESLAFGIEDSTAPYAPGAAPYSTAGNCSTWDFFFNSAVWQACANAAQNSQIQSVVVNAQNGYGTDSVAAAVAAQAAEAQEAATDSDTSNIASYYGAGSLLATPGGLSTSGFLGIPWWVWAAGGVALVLFLERR